MSVWEREGIGLRGEGWVREEEDEGFVKKEEDEEKSRV